MIFAQKFYDLCTVDMLGTSTLNLQTTVVSKQHDDILGYRMMMCFRMKTEWLIGLLHSLISFHSSIQFDLFKHMLKL
jgi:hypothetical protein